MKKFILILIFVTFAVLFFATKSNAISYFPIIRIPTNPVYFGGKITALKSSELASYEGGGYICEVPGTTIDIDAIKGDYSYLIPDGVYPRTRHSVNIGQSIIGVQEGSTTINCKRCQTEDGNSSGPEKQCWKASFELSTIRLFGTSRY